MEEKRDTVHPVSARTKSDPNVMIVARSPEEKKDNPERLNMDRRNLFHCPVLEGEDRLKLLNFQYNQIQCIDNLFNLPNLIFLDLYNNKIKVNCSWN